MNPSPSGSGSLGEIVLDAPSPSTHVPLGHRHPLFSRWVRAQINPFNVFIFLFSCWLQGSFTIPSQNRYWVTRPVDFTSLPQRFPCVPRPSRCSQVSYRFALGSPLRRSGLECIEVGYQHFHILAALQISMTFVFIPSGFQLCPPHSTPPATKHPAFRSPSHLFSGNLTMIPGLFPVSIQQPGLPVLLRLR